MRENRGDVWGHGDGQAQPGNPDGDTIELSQEDDDRRYGSVLSADRISPQLTSTSASR